MTEDDNLQDSAAPPTRQWRFWLAITIGTIVAVYVLKDVLLPFVAGAAVAYFLDPIADWLERRGLSRAMATVVITVFFIFAIVAVILLLIPAIQRQIADFLGNLPTYAAAIEARVAPIVDWAREVLPHDQMQRLQEGALGFIGDATGWMLALLRRVLTSGIAILSLLSLLLITPVVAFYLLRDWDALVAKVDEWLPRAHAQVIREQFRQIDTILAGFVRGQATVCLVLGVFYAAGLTLAGLDLGLVVGLLSGLLSFIPYLGSITGFVVSVGLALAQFSDWGPVLLVAGIYILGQFLEGNFLSPWLVGERVGLHPVWVIFALLAGGALFGFVGVLLAVPVAAVIGVLTRFFLSRYLESDYYHTRAARTGIRVPSHKTPDGSEE